MVWYSIKTAFQYLKSQGKYSVLNISGLTLGLVLTMMMIMLIYHELSFDGFHPEKDNILKVCTHDLKSGEFHSTTPGPLSLTLKNDYPEVKNVTGIYKILYNEAEIEFNNLSYSGFTGASVESDIFSMFRYNMILGEKETVIDAANKVAVSESFAHRIFGSENPVGKSISIRNHEFVISGLYEDLPDNSEVKFDILFSDKVREILWEKFPVAWWSSGLHTYVMLEDNYPAEQFDILLKGIPDKYYPDFLKGRSTFFTKLFIGLHFNSSIHGGLVPAVSPIYLIMLGSIALITLLIACINFINLSTCQIAKRNKDTGIRKIVGAGKNHIVSLQIWYSIISAGIAVLLAFLLCYALLPYFEQLTQRSLLGHFFNPQILGFIALTVFTIAGITGFIPGLFYSRIPAIKALQFKVKRGADSSTAQNSFVIVQLSIVVVVITAQLFIFKQISFMRNADLGFNNDNLLAIHVNNFDEKNYGRKYQMAQNYKQELEKFSAQFGYGKGVITENIPGFYYQNSFTLVPVNGNIDECLVTSTAIDENFLEVYEIPLAEGRFFSKEIQSDK